MSRPPGTYSEHDDVFTSALGSVRQYIRDVQSGMVDDDGEDLSSVASAVAELILRDIEEGATADDAYRAIESHGVTIPNEVKELAATYIY